MTLQELKDKYAESQGYDNWIELLDGSFELVQEYDIHIYNIIVLAQKEALKNASEKTSEQYVRPITLNYQEIKDLITNESNLIK